MSASFELLLFSVDVVSVRDAARGGVDGVVVDWERGSKAVRQSGGDTEINLDTLDDLRRVRAASTTPVVCRVNGPDELTTDEIEDGIEGGANELLVPMARAARDIERIIERVGGRCGVGMLIETPEAVACAADFASLPLSRVYVGLNDLAIARRSACLFEAVADGTVDRLRPLFSVPFGFGGLTLPDAGHPIPCRLLMAEMMRLACKFSFLRRSFHRDVRGRSVPNGLRAIRRGLDQAGRRSPRQVAIDREAFNALVLACMGGYA